jgi:hypothetical protein
MRNKIDTLIDQLENHLECWKQFNHYINLGREKRFSEEDDSHFLEIKSLLIQELELILAAVEVASPTRDEIHTLIGSTPSLRYLSEMGDGAMRNLENQWHRIYIGWHAILGQLKVRQTSEEPKPSVSSFFGKK